jgi:hypothetical protein
MRRQLPAVAKHGSPMPSELYPRITDEELLARMATAVIGSGKASLGCEQASDHELVDLIDLMRAASKRATMAGIVDGFEELDGGKAAIRNPSAPSPLKIAAKLPKRAESALQDDKLTLYQRAAASGSAEDQCW